MREKIFDLVALLMSATIGVLVFIFMWPIMAPKFYNIGVVLYMWLLYLVKNPMCDILMMLCE